MLFQYYKCEQKNAKSQVLICGLALYFSSQPRKSGTKSTYNVSLISFVPYFILSAPTLCWNLLNFVELSS